MAPQGLETPDKLPALAVALHRHGNDAPAVAKILEANRIRLFRKVSRQDLRLLTRTRPEFRTRLSPCNATKILTRHPPR